MFSLTIKIDLNPVDKNGKTVSIKSDEIVPYVAKVIEQRLRETDLILWAKPLARIAEIGVSARAAIGFIHQIEISKTDITGPDGFHSTGS